MFCCSLFSFSAVLSRFFGGCGGYFGGTPSENSIGLSDFEADLPLNDALASLSADALSDCFCKNAGTDLFTGSFGLYLFELSTEESGFSSLMSYEI